MIDTDKIFENVKCPISVLISNYEEYGDFLSEITEKYFSKLPKGSKIDVIRDDLILLRDWLNAYLNIVLLGVICLKLNMCCT